MRVKRLKKELNMTKKTDERRKKHERMKKIATPNE